ncbi:porin [Paraburkholderia sacchari]|uniref:Porin n=1 Tax=Paraburkholderia sacchari TaxID=159450 RepID=A0A8T6ZH84_9BURK|nr:porin [Paraburkholderia sacchari]NLP63962.1 porin [Paraburkholderia sacchari]
MLQTKKRLREGAGVRSCLRNGMVVAALATAGYSTAWAQSTVTLYGIVDAAVQYGKFNDTVSPTAMAASGNLQASRFGFRGSEDLGGGYRANFQLETGFNTYTGVGGGTTMFNRGASVGLSSATYGSIDAGFMYLPIYWVFLGSDVSTYGLSNPAAIMSLEHTVTLGKSGTGGFYPNAVRYRTPNYNGFSSEIGYSFGAQNASGQTANGRNIGANVMYQRFGMMFGYGFNRYQYYADATTLTPSSQLTHVVAATYAYAGNFIGANYIYSKRTDSTNWFASAFLLNAKIPAGPGDIELGVSRRIENGNARAMAYDAGYVYFLSKRTQLYGYATMITNNSHSSQGFALLNSNFATVTPGFSPWAVTAGLRTSF